LGRVFKKNKEEVRLKARLRFAVSAYLELAITLTKKVNEFKSEPYEVKMEFSPDQNKMILDINNQSL
jgi:uncharacterized protein YfcZ (UPF0381/DUF406 family)